MGRIRERNARRGKPPGAGAAQATDRLALLLPVLGECPQLRHVVVIGDEAATAPSQATLTRWRDLVDAPAKPAHRVIDTDMLAILRRLRGVDFIGFEIDDVFVVGYGIDYAERYRHLPFIGRVEQGLVEVDGGHGTTVPEVVSGGAGHTPRAWAPQTVCRNLLLQLH